MTIFQGSLNLDLKPGKLSCLKREFQTAVTYLGKYLLCQNSNSFQVWTIAGIEIPWFLVHFKSVNMILMDVVGLDRSYCKFDRQYNRGTLIFDY